jgi:methyltransferase, FkbM family
MKISWHKKLSRTLRGRLRKRILSRFGIGVCAETYNGVFITDPGDFVVSRALLGRGEYDRAEIEWLLEAIGPSPDTLMIVGVHVGALLVPLARRAQRVIGFEPNPPTYKLARLNLLLNDVTNVTLEHRAVGQSSGAVSIVANPINTGNATVRAAEIGDADSVEQISLDDYCSRHAIQTIDLLVIDIEGYELHALRGADQTLAHTRTAYIEYAPEQLRQHGSDPATLIDLLLPRFNHMYLLDDGVREFTPAEAQAYLKNLPERKGLLLDLLLTKDKLTGAARHPRR